MIALLLAALNPVLLVHGIDDTAALFDTLKPRLERAGWTAEAFDMVPNNGDRGLEVLAAQIKTHAAALKERTHAAQIDVVAFSLGTLASRYYLQRLGGAHEVARFVSISGPHHGTLTAYIRNNPGTVEMRTRSAFLEDLNRDWDATAREVRTTAIWTPLDLMIVPAHSSQLPLSKEITVPVLLHPWMMKDDRVGAAVEAALRENLAEVR